MSVFYLDDKCVVKIWDSIDTQTANGCWEWCGGKTTDGYGGIRVDGKKRRAHRVVWQLMRGFILDDLCVLHHCDNKLCVNPVHLFLGTPIENMRDRDSKDRQWRGEQYQRGLTNIKIQEIRQKLKNGELQRSIATQYNVCQSTISKIKLKKIWRHLREDIDV